MPYAQNADPLQQATSVLEGRMARKERKMKREAMEQMASQGRLRGGDTLRSDRAISGQVGEEMAAGQADIESRRWGAAEAEKQRGHESGMQSAQFGQETGMANLTHGQTLERDRLTKELQSQLQAQGYSESDALARAQDMANEQTQRRQITSTEGLAGSQQTHERVMQQENFAGQGGLESQRQSGLMELENFKAQETRYLTDQGYSFADAQRKANENFSARESALNKDFDFQKMLSGQAQESGMAGMQIGAQNYFNQQGYGQEVGMANLNQGYNWNNTQAGYNQQAILANMGFDAQREQNNWQGMWNNYARKDTKAAQDAAEKAAKSQAWGSAIGGLVSGVTGMFNFGG
jgi:hypothetical protein